MNSWWVILDKHLSLMLIILLNLFILYCINFLSTLIDHDGEVMQILLKCLGVVWILFIFSIMIFNL